jgi:DNA-binding helix-hairpin-helix protein with protein kinase domain
MSQLTLAYARTRVFLGQKLGSGGEGDVFALEGRTDQVAKIYSALPDNQKVQKLLAMSETGNSSILNIAAWPLDLLLDAKGKAKGFIMQRVRARRNIHELYGPKSRAEAFPEADFRFLVHVGANIARAFAVIHEQGHIIGDVNHSNLLVGPNGTVTLIDCDSFQVRRGSTIFTCEVGSPLFTAPEIQGRSLRGLKRTENHDLFGLAVLLFHLLYMGRHPFAGRYKGHGDMPIEKAVAEYRFAYGPDASANRMERPPGTIPLKTFGDMIAQLFIRAFGNIGANGGRPNARTWIQALESLKQNLRVCAQANWHHFPRNLQSCPWCDVEAHTGARLFGQRIIETGPTGTINVSQLWEAVVSVPNPGADPDLPSELPWSPPPGVKLPKGILKMVRKCLSIGIVCAGIAACNVLAKNGGAVYGLISFGLACAVWPHVQKDKKAEVDRSYSIAFSEWNSALSRWKREASREAFDKKREELVKAYMELNDLPNERQRRFAKLESEREMRQRKRYLDRFKIGQSNIPGIGPTRTAMLASYGIETASDVDSYKINRIPGFGRVLTSELVGWRRRHERNYRFNPNEPIDRRDIMAMDRDLEVRKQTWISALQQGPLELRRLNQEINASRPRLLPKLQEAWTALKIAEAHRNAL